MTSFPLDDPTICWSNIDGRIDRYHQGAVLDGRIDIYHHGAVLDGRIDVYIIKSHC